ncbi:glycosyltransferase family 2 protein [Pleionea mediterranea]|nr:glycosyltransferase [Pleionea mediterranea]
MTNKQRKTIAQRIKWWWNTRVMGLWRVKLGGASQRKKLASAGTVEFNQKATPMPEAKSSGITVILTAYRRAEYLADQIKALRNQSVPPDEIWVWSNQSEEDLLDVSELADRVVASNTNWLFWGRFALAHLVRTEFVAFFDDDILPQPRWFENCLNTIKAGNDGILGGSGVLLPESGGYSSKQKAGWNGLHSTETQVVDLVGHAWFFRKRHINFMWREEPAFWDNGEDIHLSYMALKHGGVETFVPPHPEHDETLWSCRPDFGKTVGRMKVATYKTKDHRDTRSQIVNRYLADGWQQVWQRVSKSDTRQRQFKTELEWFNQKLSDHQSFSLVRFGDGEMLVINGEAVDLSEKCNGEHKYTPGDERDESYRSVLEQSLLFRHPQYFIGLPCRCCVGDQHCERLRAQSQQPDAQLTWANLFVNANYPRFLESTLPLLNDRQVVMVCHEQATFDDLPFKVTEDFRVGKNAWTEDFDRLLKEITLFIEDNNIQNHVFIFCAGVLSNMLIYKLTETYPNNTYLDTGSVFDDMMGLGQTRKYLKGSKRRLTKECVW